MQSLYLEELRKLDIISESESPFNEKLHKLQREVSELNNAGKEVPPKLVKEIQWLRFFERIYKEKGMSGVKNSYEYKLFKSRNLDDIPDPNNHTEWHNHHHEEALKHGKEYSTKIKEYINRHRFKYETEFSGRHIKEVKDLHGLSEKVKEHLKKAYHHATESGSEHDANRYAESAKFYENESKILKRNLRTLRLGRYGPTVGTLAVAAVSSLPVIIGAINVNRSSVCGRYIADKELCNLMIKLRALKEVYRELSRKERFESNPAKKEIIKKKMEENLKQQREIEEKIERLKRIHEGRKKR